MKGGEIMKIEMTQEHKQNIAKAREALAKAIDKEGLEPSCEMYKAANKLIHLTSFACEEIPGEK